MVGEQMPISTNIVSGCENPARPIRYKVLIWSTWEVEIWWTVGNRCPSEWSSGRTERNWPGPKGTNFWCDLAGKFIFGCAHLVISVSFSARVWWGRYRVKLLGLRTPNFSGLIMTGNRSDCHLARIRRGVVEGQDRKFSLHSVGLRPKHIVGRYMIVR